MVVSKESPRNWGFQKKPCAKSDDPVENILWVRPEGGGPALLKILDLATVRTKVANLMILLVVGKQSFLAWWNHTRLFTWCAAR